MSTSFDLLVATAATAGGVLAYSTSPIKGAIYSNPAVVFLGSIVPLLLSIIFLSIGQGWSGFLWGVGAAALGAPLLGRLPFSGILIALPIPLMLIYFFVR